MRNRKKKKTQDENWNDYTKLREVNLVVWISWHGFIQF
jgi:hypothetical protein